MFAESFLSFFGFLPEVRRQLEAVDLAPAVTDYQDRLLGVECYFVKGAFMRRYDFLEINKLSNAYLD